MSGLPKIIDAIAMSAPAALLISDSDGRILAANEKAARLAGRKAADLLGLEVTSTLWCDHCRALHADALNRARTSGAVAGVVTPDHFECAIRNSDGDEVPVEATVSLLQLEDQTLSLLHFCDISMRVGTETENARRIEHSERVSAVRSRIVGMLAHDMRTALGGVLGASTLLESDMSAADRSEIISAIRASAETMSVLLEDAITLAQNDAGEIGIRKVPTRVNDLIEQIARTWRNDIHAANAQLTLDIAPDVPQMLRIDPDRMRQVIGNLLSNACKYSGAANIRLAVTRENEGTIVFEVADDGVGFGDEALDGAFEPFRRPQGQNAEGTGLGLSIVRTITRRMGGTVEIDTSRKGARILIRLGECGTDICATGADCQPPPRAAAFFNNARVLLVEDNKTNHLIATRMLEKLGLNVTGFETGYAGLEAARNSPFDAIIMDIDLPDLDGTQVIRRIRDCAGPNQKAPIVAFTAFALPEQQGPIFEAGADRIICKPVKSTDAFAVPLHQLGLSARHVSAATLELPPPQSEALTESQLDDLRNALGAGGFAELTAAFLTDLNTLSGQLEQPDVDPSELRKVSHVAISVAGALGARGATEEAEALNRAAHAEDLNAVRNHQTRLHSALRETTLALETYREAHK